MSSSAAAAKPPRLAYIRSPELIPARRQSQATSRGPPLAANRPGEASFLISGSCSRRHCPGQFGTTRASHSPFSPPRAPSSSREPFPLLNFDRDTPREKNHFAPEATSAEKLAAGSSLRPHLPGDHREDRPGVADPSPPSKPRGEPPLAGDDRHCLASARDRERRGRRLVKPD